MNKPSWKYFFTATALLVLSTVWGVYVGRNSNSPELIENSFSIFSLFQDIPPFLLFVLILLNNAIKTFFVVLLGFLFGLVPLYFLYINGTILGIVIALLNQKVGSFPIFAGLLPHGVFEIAGFLLATTYGLWLGVKFWQRITKKEPFLPYLKQSMLIFVKIVLPLLFVAAIIEAYLTPVFLNMTLQK